MARETVEYVREHLVELERMVRDDGHHPLAALINLAVMETEEILKFKRPPELVTALLRHNPAAVLPFPPGKKP
jgi:hypothetical protein